MPGCLEGNSSHAAVATCFASQAAELTLVHGFAHFAHPIAVIPRPAVDGAQRLALHPLPSCSLQAGAWC